MSFLSSLLASREMLKLSCLASLNFLLLDFFDNGVEPMKIKEIKCEHQSCLC